MLTLPMSAHATRHCEAPPCRSIAARLTGGIASVTRWAMSSTSASRAAARQGKFRGVADRDRRLSARRSAARFTTILSRSKSISAPSSSKPEPGRERRSREWMSAIATMVAAPTNDPSGPRAGSAEHLQLDIVMSGEDHRRSEAGSEHAQAAALAQLVRHRLHRGADVEEDQVEAERQKPRSDHSFSVSDCLVRPPPDRWMRLLQREDVRTQEAFSRGFATFQNLPWYSNSLLVTPQPRDDVEASRVISRCTPDVPSASNIAQSHGQAQGSDHPVQPFPQPRWSSIATRFMAVPPEW